MPVTTVSAAVHITPVVIQTFFGHGKRKAIKYKQSVEEEEATDDIFFDEAFHIVKAFIDLGINNTVESLQEFTNTHVPAPYWASVCSARIPLTTCNDAADILINWFGPQEIKHVVGGERWWQVRGLDGIDAEWITEKEYLSDDKSTETNGYKLSDEEEKIQRMDHLDNVMLYVHGGGYFWGSINTHRYQIIRYARKCKGRAFAVNYRKAPQYPWPCPLQDVIAAYLYLIRPPKGANHKPIAPSKISLAGDSAGGGLCLSVLTVLRDMEVPLPAGAVLISPWVDLTHSFPSVMQNTNTDIIPEHGFLAKPSALWPIDTLPPDGGRMGPTSSGPPPEPGHADTLYPSEDRVEHDEKENQDKGKVQPQEEMLAEKAPPGHNEESSSSTITSSAPRADQSTEEDYDIDRWEPKPPKVFMKDPEAVPLELRSQIQLYATNEQLTHPLVSPILQSTLGGLPPLYILAGDGEVLRDEIIWLAHKAARPSEYPTRRGVLRDARRQKENVERFTTPTKVHLQVFDGMCHVPTVFMFTDSAKSAYRSIAQFVKNVTADSPDGIPPNPFPKNHHESFDEHDDHKLKEKKSWFSTLSRSKGKDNSRQTEKDGDAASNNDDTKEAGTLLINQQLHDEPKDFRDVLILRERVSIKGVVRAMEPESEIAALQLKPGEVGLIKEAPAVRWHKGQEEWDRRFKKRAKKILKQRAKVEKKAVKMVASAKEQGLVVSDKVAEEGPSSENDRVTTSEDKPPKKISKGTIQRDRRWGPLDLDDEMPPPSAIAKRRDTPESLALLKKHIYYSAPVTHSTVPRLKPGDAILAAFDPHDDPIWPPKQSVSEQQTKTHINPMHGLKIWDALLGYFMRESTKKTADIIKDKVQQYDYTKTPEAEHNQ